MDSVMHGLGGGEVMRRCPSPRILRLEPPLRSNNDNTNNEHDMTAGKVREQIRKSCDYNAQCTLIYDVSQK